MDISITGIYLLFDISLDRKPPLRSNFPRIDKPITKLKKICEAVANQKSNIYLVKVEKSTQVLLEIKGKKRKNMEAFLNHVKVSYEGNTAAGNSTNGANKLKF